MKFIDEVDIQVISGQGGKGASSFRREKFVPRGGPDGGNGGKGGDVIFEGDEGLNTLVHFRGKKVYQAEEGQAGAGWQCDGKNGEDLIIKVPIGTIITNLETGEVMADILEHGFQALVAQGGRGGLGNTYFKTSTNQAPTYSQLGDPATILNVKLELKLLADIALVGLPNAGKSTLISRISQAKPKIADYPFTTLEPQLGVVQFRDTSFVVADIPGLIENAAEGKGLGIRFLKHIERTKALVHLIDCSMLIEAYEAIENYSIVKAELLKFSENLRNKREIVCLTKVDAMSEEDLAKFCSAIEEEIDRKVIPISSASGKNIDLLIEIMVKAINK